MNFLPASANGAELAIQAAAAPIPVPSLGGKVVEVGVRPEHLALCGPDDADFSGEIELLERLGAETFAYVRVPGLDQNLTLRLSDRRGPDVGSAVNLRIDRANLHLFGESARVPA